jgi:hypothetical protein
MAWNDSKWMMVQMEIVSNGSAQMSITAMFDFDIDTSSDTTFNENGALVGTLAAGQSWEIDEPGYVFGDVYDNVLSGVSILPKKAPNKIG